MKVFKIPDDNGVITYRVQTPDGVWHDTDELGNFLPEGSEAPRKEPGETEVIPVPSVQAEKTREKTRPPQKDRVYVNVGVRFSEEEYNEFSEYIYWRCYFKEKCSKGSFLTKLALDAVRKDREYREFRKKL